MSDRRGDASGPGSRASTEPATQSPPSASIPIADLIKRLAAATEGSYELDFAILRHVYPDWEIWVEPAVPALLMNARVMCRPHGSGAEHHISVSAYTRSLDAALTLVPDGTDFNIRRIWCVGRAAHITDGTATWQGESTTEELALCIAALKARAHV